MIAGGYTLDLYCDNYSTDRKFVNLIDELGHDWGMFPTQYTGEHGSRVRARARRAGWLLNLRNGYALCPLCNKAGVTLKDLPIFS